MVANPRCPHTPRLRHIAFTRGTRIKDTAAAAECTKMLGSTSPSGPTDHFARPRNAPEPPETSPPSSARRSRTRTTNGRRGANSSHHTNAHHHHEDYTSGTEEELVSPGARVPPPRTSSRRTLQHPASAASLPPSSPGRTLATHEEHEEDEEDSENTLGRGTGNGLAAPPLLLGGMTGFAAVAPVAAIGPGPVGGGFFSGLAPLPPLPPSGPKQAAPVTFNFVTGEAKPVSGGPKTPETKGGSRDSKDADHHAAQQPSTGHSVQR